MFGKFCTFAKHLKSQNRMPTIKTFVKKSTQKNNKYSNVRFYISGGRGIMPYYKSDILVDFNHWDAKNQCLKPKAHINPIERSNIEKLIIERKSQLLSAFETLVINDIRPTSEALTDEMNMILNPKIVPRDERTFFDWFSDYQEKTNVSEVRKKYYKVVRRNLEKFELYKRISQPNFRLNITEFSAETAFELERFLLDEYNIAKKYPHLYKDEKEDEKEGKKKKTRETKQENFRNCRNQSYGYHYG